MNDENRPSPETFDVPIVGRRRVALLHGACGVFSRLHIAGQILDVPILQSHLNEPWSRRSMLPHSLTERFRAVQDAGINAVRGPHLKVDVLHAEEVDPDRAPPLSEWDVRPDGGTTFSIDTSSLPPLPPGKYLLRLSLLGVDSIRQHITDLAYLGTGSTQYSQKDTVVGFGTLRVLDAEHADTVVMSDIDQTFLDTKIDSRQGLMETLFERVESKRPLPGMQQFYTEIRRKDIPLFFVSASPNFFRRTLEAVFERFQIEHDGLFLKSLLGPINSIVRKAFDVLSNIEEYLTQNMNDAMERSTKFLGSTMQSMVDQIAYKLTVLLEQRTMMPSRTKEVLIGDNTESDYLIFTLYQHLLLGSIPVDKIDDYFYHLKFHNREAVTRDAAQRIADLVEKNLAIHGAINPVEAVWIHRARSEMRYEEMIASMEEAVADLRRLIGEKTICAPVDYAHAFELALLAWNDSLIDAEAVLRVADTVVDQTLRGETLDRQTLVNCVQAFPFRKAVHREQMMKALSR